MSPIDGINGYNLPVNNDNYTGANEGNTQNSAADFANILSDSIKDQMMQTMMSKMQGSSGQANNMLGGAGGFGGMNNMLGGIGGLSGIGAMGGPGGMGAMGGLSGPGGIMGMPGMENTLISAAESGEMSGAQLALFLMIMMMQNSEGGDMAPIMQMLAGLLSSFSSDAENNRANNMMALLGNSPANMQGAPQGSTPTDVKRMVDAALEQVGYREKNRDGSEGNGNMTKFGAWYGMDGQPWCAMFVSWAADQAGIMGDVVPKHASTIRGMEAYKEKDLYSPRSSGYIPREGDAVYFTSANGGRIRHVGIVVAYDPQNQRVYTVEGNTDNAVRIRHYDLNNSRIHGYGRNGGTSFGTVPVNSSSGSGARTI